jgi:hypothetical protein
VAETSTASGMPQRLSAFRARSKSGFFDSIVVTSLDQKRRTTNRLQLLYLSWHLASSGSLADMTRTSSRW